jgi:hypothetical protein
MWTALQFDSAVRAFGIHIENRMSERDENGNPVNSLETLLDIKVPDSELLRRNSEQFAAFMVATGGTVRAAIQRETDYRPSPARPTAAVTATRPAHCAPQTAKGTSAGA